MPPLLSVLTCEHEESNHQRRYARMEAASAFTNAIQLGSAEQVRYLVVDQQCIQPLCALLHALHAEKPCAEHPYAAAIQTVLEAMVILLDGGQTTVGQFGEPISESIGFSCAMQMAAAGAMPEVVQSFSEDADAAVASCAGAVLLLIEKHCTTYAKALGCIPPEHHSTASCLSGEVAGFRFQGLEDVLPLSLHGVFTVCPENPTANGQPHYKTPQGGHLYCRKGKWLMNGRAFTPDTLTGGIAVIKSAGEVPKKASWDCFDSEKWTKRTLTLTELTVEEVAAAKVDKAAAAVAAAATSVAQSKQVRSAEVVFA